MDHGVWKFVRGNDTLQITREELDDGITLVIAGDGTPRSYFFRETHRLETFQRDMETLLLKTGWTFQTYAPDRRTGRDRRGWPRRSNDRRRWWTDGRGDEPVDSAEAAKAPGEKTGTDERTAPAPPAKKYRFYDFRNSGLQDFGIQDLSCRQIVKS